MKKRLLAVFLAFVMCMGLTVPAFADDWVLDYSANGHTDPAAENVTFSVAPIGVAKIRWVAPWDTTEYTVYVFDQDCVVTRKDGLPLKVFGLPPMFGDVGYAVSMGAYDQWASVEEEWAWVEEAGSAGIRADRADGSAFHFAPNFTDEGDLDWSPLMMSKKGLDTVFPYEELTEYYDENNDEWVEARITGTVLEYRALSSQPTTPTVGGFTDVKADNWFADPVLWAVSKDITNGTGGGKFSPAQQCTHAQILTFLYRADRGQGKAEAADMDKAVAWAREKGMIDSSFDGKAYCTRADAVSYIWQALGRENAKSSGFTDVPAGAGYAKAVDWAVANGVTNGTNAAQTEFSPNTVCDRGTIVTFLHRAYVPEARLK